MYNQGSQPTMTESVVELADSMAESANLTFRSTQPQSRILDSQRKRLLQRHNATATQGDIRQAGWLVSQG